MHAANQPSMGLPIYLGSDDAGARPRYLMALLHVIILASYFYQFFNSNKDQYMHMRILSTHNPYTYL